MGVTRLRSTRLVYAKFGIVGVAAIPNAHTRTLSGIGLRLNLELAGK